MVLYHNPQSRHQQGTAHGVTDDETGTSFIPAFSTKEDAQQCFLMMPKDVINEKYEVQAIIAEDLISMGKTSGHVVYHLDHKGEVKETITR